MAILNFYENSSDLVPSVTRPLNSGGEVDKVSAIKIKESRDLYIIWKVPGYQEKQRFFAPPQRPSPITKSSKCQVLHQHISIHLINLQDGKHCIVWHLNLCLQWKIAIQEWNIRASELRLGWKNRATHWEHNTGVQTFITKQADCPFLSFIFGYLHK